MSWHRSKLIVAALTTAIGFTDCVKIPENVEDGDGGDATLSDQPNATSDVARDGSDGANSQDISSVNGDGASSDSDASTVDPDGAQGSMDGNGTDASEMDANGACVGMGRMTCAGSCVDTQSSALHCGACGNACPMGQSCISGECRCAGTQVVCGGSCVDTQANNTHCGRCGNACPAGINCVGGVCACPGMGQVACGGSCVSTQSNNMHCGMCNNACAGGQVCTGGSCQCPAANPQMCGGMCVNTTTDNNNCGACGMACGMGRVCVAGSCQCAAALTMCGASCVDTATSNMHCGACNNACSAVQTCVGGACTCPMGQADCAANGTCLDLSADRNNCGACGRVCPGGPGAVAMCNAGACALSCAVGFADCDGDPMNGCEADLNSSAANCGSCGARCATGVCMAGGCQQWARQVGESGAVGNESGLDVAEDRLGNVYFVGTAQRSFNLGGGAVPVQMTAGFIVSYNTRGALRWSRIVDAVGEDAVTTVSVRTVGGAIRVFIAGNASGPVNLGNGAIGGAGLKSFMAEYDENGTHLWSTTMQRTGGGAFSINESAMSSTGEIYITGQYSTFIIQGTTVNNPVFMNNPGSAILLKLNPMGMYQWTRWVGSLQNIGAGKVVATDSLGNVIFGGLIDEVVDAGGGPRGVAGSLNDLFIAKYDSNNNHLWSSVFGGNNQEQAVSGIAVNPFSNVVTIAGHYPFPGGLDFGTGALPAVAPFSNLFLANFTANGNGGQAQALAARSYATGSLGDTSPAGLAYTSDTRLFLHDSTSGAAVIGGFNVIGGPGRRTYVAEINPDSLVFMNLLSFNGISADNRAFGISGCGVNYVCITGRFNQNYGFAMTTLTTTALATDFDVFFARVNRP